MRDFVFASDGNGGLEFLGDFDGLYRHEDDPWQQSGTEGDMALYYRFSRKRLAEAIVHTCPGATALEVGSGLGHVVDYLNKFGACAAVNGMDVSRIAVTRAKRRYPAYTFLRGDIAATDLELDRRYGCIILNQVLWYILERMPYAIDNCHRLIEGRGVLMFSQAFLQGEQKYGKEIADGFNGFLRMMDRYSDRFTLIEAAYDDSGMLCHNDGLAVFRKA